MEFSEVTSSHDSSFLPPEIIYEILLRLPVKTLLKVKCISKSWLSQISTPQFIKAHLKLSSKKQFLLLNKRDKNKHTFYTWFLEESLYQVSSNIYYESSPMYSESSRLPDELDFPCKEPASYVVGSCDGLICITTSAKDSKDLFLRNPSTRKLKKLPLSGRNADNRSYLCFGFGYNERQDDYQLVEVDWFVNDSWIYSLRANCWEEVQRFPCDIFFDNGVFVNGRLHWRSNHDNVNDNMHHSWFICSFNLIDKTYENIARPRGLEFWDEVFDDDDLRWEQLTILGGNLCVIWECNKAQAEVWVMKEYGVVESWTMLGSVHYSSPFIKDPILTLPIFISRDGEVLLLESDSTLWLCDLTTDDCFQGLWEDEDSRIQFRCDYNCMYIESLVSPNFGRKFENLLESSLRGLVCV